MHADAVQRADARQLLFDEAVVDRAGAARQREARGFALAGGVVETHIDARGGARADGEVHAVAGECGSQQIGRACPSSADSPQKHRRQRRQPHAQRVREAVHDVRKRVIARDARESGAAEARDDPNRTRLRSARRRARPASSRRAARAWR